MKLASYRTFIVPPRWLFLKVETKEGLVGWGEPILEGRARTVAAAVAELMDKYVMKMDVSNVEDVWQVLYRGGFYRGGPILMSALAGIDQALWDIKGKSVGVPVYKLLGGSCRDKVRVYRWVGGDSPSEVAEEAVNQIKAGFTALKMNVAGRLRTIESAQKVREVVTRFARVREAVGEDVDLAIDFHGRVSPSLTPQLARALEPYSPLFIEEPMLPLLHKRLTQLKTITSIPLAFGERLYSRWDFRSFLEAGLLDVAQPDLSHAGGITECKKIVSLAETYGTQVAFHCPLGPIALAACIQVAATAPNFLIQETSIGIHYNEGIEMTDYLEDSSVFAIKDGFVSLLTKPGLGITIDENAVRNAAIQGHNWMNPLWRHEDGSLAEW
ncbi:MAG: galactonate dehydratase [Palaeococcus sp.]|uniref:galactonate dehydratase n=1 Tax=Palaeococcus sp. (in: euryarchaeotes) TaxID=2820298 RepID=UPI0025DEE106|nr:galactonate dehydratase [Palaeococcus sp. (in: euryarchaeotes)]MCD6558618.1 galactonate dehydratase [Palaeococcus sp. (in: euryarchaeotes)]